MLPRYAASIIPTVCMLILANGISSAGADVSKLQISSSAISEGATIPAEFTCAAENKSPPLAWTGVSSSAKSLALVLDDTDAPSGTFTHWVVYDIPPTSSGFKAGEVEGKQGLNSLGKAAYMGPCPPPGSPHHYHFRLFVLDGTPEIQNQPNAQALRDAMSGHIIQSAELVGMFGREAQNH
jgi:Raf kinase inhibitor-like YbhB/YbcL family protein